MTVRLGLLATRIRAEEKMLIERARDMPNVELVRIGDGAVTFDLHTPPEPAVDVVLERDVSASAALYAMASYERHGVPVVNSFAVSALCGDKWRTSLALAAHGVPTPRTRIAFTAEDALALADGFGYPCVTKPVTGSWARLVNRLDTRAAAEAVFEHKEVLGHYMHHIYYVQEFVDKPGRDIRSFVVGDDCIAAIYRNNAEHWITNTARGGKATNCPVTDEVREISLRAAEAVGGGILAIDLMETGNGLTCHEVNDRMEFRNSVSTTGVDIPQRMLDHVVREARR